MPALRPIKAGRRPAPGRVAAPPGGGHTAHLLPSVGWAWRDPGSTSGDQETPPAPAYLPQRDS